MHAAFMLGLFVLAMLVCFCSCSLDNVYQCYDISKTLMIELFLSDLNACPNFARLPCMAPIILHIIMQCFISVSRSSPQMTIAQPLSILVDRRNTNISDLLLAQFYDALAAIFLPLHEGPRLPLDATIAICHPLGLNYDSSTLPEVYVQRIIEPELSPERVCRLLRDCLVLANAFHALDIITASLPPSLSAFVKQRPALLVSFYANVDALMNFSPFSPRQSLINSAQPPRPPHCESANAQDDIDYPGFIQFLLPISYEKFKGVDEMNVLTPQHMVWLVLKCRFKATIHPLYFDAALPHLDVLCNSIDFTNVTASNCFAALDGCCSLELPTDSQPGQAAKLLFIKICELSTSVIPELSLIPGFSINATHYNYQQYMMYLKGASNPSSFAWSTSMKCHYWSLMRDLLSRFKVRMLVLVTEKPLSRICYGKDMVLICTRAAPRLISYMEEFFVDPSLPIHFDVLNALRLPIEVSGCSDIFGLAYFTDLYKDFYSFKSMSLLPTAVIDIDTLFSVFVEFLILQKSKSFFDFHYIPFVIFFFMQDMSFKLLPKRLKDFLFLICARKRGIFRSENLRKCYQVYTLKEITVIKSAADAQNYTMHLKSINFFLYLQCVMALANALKLQPNISQAALADVWTTATQKEQTLFKI